MGAARSAPRLHLLPMPKRSSTDLLRIAHRGAGAMERYANEDLLSVAREGAHLVEFDLHVTGDDRLVARHNPIITISGSPAWLADHRLVDALPALRQANTPLVEDIVQAAKDAGLGLYADIKSVTRSAARRFLSILESQGMSDRTIFASVRSDIVALCAEIAPRIPRAVMFASTLEEPVQLATAINAQYVHPCWESLPRPDEFLKGPWLDRVRRHNLGVICWHEERPEVIEGLYDLGVDGICTDNPSLLTEIALRR
jgi:glycerophosphoryl diester phosphodiesterase